VSGVALVENLVGTNAWTDCHGWTFCLGLH
jgi:hypothetical protein